MAKSFPFYKQLDEMDCGAACLRMIARHYGRFYSLEHLRELTYVGKQGVTLLGISDAAEEIGLQTLAVHTTYDQFQSVIPVPCIAHWGDAEHFVVVYRVSKHSVWIADPAEGKFKISKEEFIQKWANDKTKEGEAQGVLLLLQITPEFYQQDGEEIDKSGFRHVFSYFRNYKWLLSQLFLGILLGGILQFIFPFMMRAIVDTGITNIDMGFIQLILISQLVLFATQTAVEYVRSWILLHVSGRVNITLISDYLFKLTKLPIRFFDSKMSGDLIQRVADHERVKRFLSSTSLLSIFSLLNYVAFGVILFLWHKGIFVTYLLGTVLYIAWVGYFIRWRKEIDYRRFDQMAENQSNLMELISGMQDIKLYNAEKQKRWAWERIQAKLFRTSLSTMRIQQIQRGGANFINETKNLIIIFLAATAVLSAELSLGTLVAILYILGLVNTQMPTLIDFLIGYQETKISLQRMNEIHTKRDEERPNEKISILPETSNLVLEDVSFQYNGPHSPMVLKDVNVRIPKGKIVAIVGRSGSGKTTLMKLLLNFYPPTEGMIKVGDINMANISHKMWREKCGVVMQDGFLFSDTIAKNIALGAEIVDKKQLLKAVKLANIQSFIETLPLGYNTRIGQDGLGLSEGQKQRLLIARAIYKNPDYLFFDEATTALDTFNEMVVMENLEDFFYRKTVVIIAHRLSTVRNADMIIVLEDGEVVEQGNHDELTYLRGAYFQLVRNQLELGA